MTDPIQAVVEAPAASGAVEKETPKIPVKPKSKAGRKTKLTPELLVELKRCFGIGMDKRRVCDLLLISESVFYHWVRQAKKDEERGKTNSRYFQFLMTIRQAQAEFDNKHLEHIGSDPDWRARAWLLERIRPDQHGPKDRRSNEPETPRQGVILEVAHPLYALFDEAKR